MNRCTKCSLAFSAVLILLAAVVYGDEASPTTQPIIAVTSLPETQPATNPTTAPATEPSVKVSAAAQTELDALRDAYKALKSLHLAATITGDFDINGTKAARKGSIVSDYQTRDDAAGRFHQVTRDDEADAGENVIGCTGEKLYAMDSRLAAYRMIDAPAKKYAAGKMPRPFYDLLTQQNPSLLLAVVEDASAEVLDGLASVDKIDDTQIGEAACPTLRLVDKEGDVIDLAMDPATHMIKRSVSDLRESYKKRNQPEVGKVLITIDYTAIEPGSATKAETFAWLPPDGARELPEAAIAMSETGGPEEASPSDALAGKSAPEFKLKRLDGKEVSLSDLKGHVIVLDFWATWCGPCRASLPHLNELYESNKDKGLAVYAIDLKEEQKEVEQGATELKLTIPVLLDSDGAVSKKYMVTGIPQTVVIGKNGKVKKVFVGSGRHEEVQKVVEEAMKQ